MEVMHMQTILILGGTGMLGHTLFKALRKNPKLNVHSTVRSLRGLSDVFSDEELKSVRPEVDAADFDSISRALASIQPDVVINCIGLIKQTPLASDPLSAITVNSQLPHRISLICRAAKARMIHISTDCVFNGAKGNYTEDDPSDATDLYGRSKFLGEVDYPHCVTLRTSIIGHELKGNFGLVEWFMAQNNSIKGFTKAIFSGFPTIEIANIIEKHVLPNKELAGLYQVSSKAISKFELLSLIAAQYGKMIEIEPYHEFTLDRSLKSDRFHSACGYVPPAWQDLIANMYQHYLDESCYRMLGH